MQLLRRPLGDQRRGGARLRSPFYSRGHNTYEYEVLALSPGAAVKQNSHSASERKGTRPALKPISQRMPSEGLAAKPTSLTARWCSEPAPHVPAAPPTLRERRQARGLYRQRHGDTALSLLCSQLELHSWTDLWVACWAPWAPGKQLGKPVGPTGSHFKKAPGALPDRSGLERSLCSPAHQAPARQGCLAAFHQKPPQDQATVKENPSSSELQFFSEA